MNLESEHTKYKNAILAALRTARIIKEQRNGSYESAYVNVTANAIIEPLEACMNEIQASGTIVKGSMDKISDLMMNKGLSYQEARAVVLAAESPAQLSPNCSVK